MTNTQPQTIPGYSNAEPCTAAQLSQAADRVAAIVAERAAAAQTAPLAEVLVAVDLREGLTAAESAELAFALESEGWA